MFAEPLRKNIVLTTPDVALCGSVIGYKPKQLVSNTPSTKQNPFQNKGDAEECGAKMVKDSRDLNQPHSSAKPRARMMPTFLLWEWTHVLFSSADLRLASVFQLNKVLLNILIRKEMTVYTIDKDSLKVSWLDMVKLEFKPMIFFSPDPWGSESLRHHCGIQEAEVQDSISASDLGKAPLVLGLPFFICKTRRLGELTAKCLSQGKQGKKSVTC